MNIVLRPWRLYANFSGRSRRTEYFVFILVRYVAMVGVLAAFGTVNAIRIGGIGPAPRPFIITAWTTIGFLYLATIVPGWSVTVRRLHDQGKSFK